MLGHGVTYFFFLKLSLAVLGLSCCLGFSLVAADEGYSLAVACGFSLWWVLLLPSQALWCRVQQLWVLGSRAPAQCRDSRASLLRGMWIFFLDQGSIPCHLHWQADSLPLSHQGSPVARFFVLTNTDKLSSLRAVTSYTCNSNASFPRHLTTTKCHVLKKIPSALEKLRTCFIFVLISVSSVIGEV